MLALHNGKNTIIVRGAPENVISRCVGYTLDGSDYKLSDFTRKKILAAAADASRTNSFLIAVACGETEEDSLRGIDAEQNLIFKGFVSFSSSLDPGIAESVYKLDGAGIETVLSSSDAYYPAYNAAKSAGIITDESQILTAEQYRSCDEGLLIANSPYYRLFLNLDEDEWLNVLKMRRDGGRITAVTAERINELPLMREADISIVPEESVDTLCQTADMILLGSGMSRIADGILNTKTICRRIRSVVSYLAVGIVMLFTASALSAFYNQIPAFRAQDVMFGGIIFNLAIAFALAYAPRSIRTLKEPFERIGEKPKLTDFIYPLMYAIGGGLVLFVCFAITGKYTCSLIALTLLQFLFACTAADHGGVIASKRFGNSLLYLVGIGIAAVLAFLMFTKPGHRWFTYGVPQASYITLTLIACLVYSVIVQVLRYFLSPHTAKLHKKKKKDELTVPEDEESPEAEEDAEDGAEDEEEPDEDFDEEEPVEEETEKEDEE
ncbi:MAG: cation-transporting P-type ATPase, partial [Clostridia bacterium]|nr:cation-transporting P-type ATPase [Clostridia bacterium]